jgi:hypothetical protein
VQEEMDVMELAKLLLQFAVVPIIAFMWAHYKITQVHEKQIAVIKTEHALVKENHDREFKEVKEALKSVMLKLDEIQKELVKR